MEGGIGRKSVIVILGLCLLLSISCSNGQEKQGVASLGPPEIELAYPHPAEIVTALELDWGRGDYQVGYINDEFREMAEDRGLPVGPVQFCVDGEGSIYVDDSMNFRYLKYDRDGEFVGEVEKERFTDSLDAPAPFFIIGGPDRMYLFMNGNTTIQSYHFETDEIRTFTLPEDSEWDFWLSSMITDPLGNVYIFGDDGNQVDSPKIMYKVDASFSTLLERRALPIVYATPIIKIDEQGNLYFLESLDAKSSGETLYRIDTSNNISEIFTIHFDNIPMIESRGEPPFISIAAL